MNERGDKPIVPVGHAQNQDETAVHPSAFDNAHKDNAHKDDAHKQESVLAGFPQERFSDNGADYGRRARRAAEPADDATTDDSARPGYRMRDFSPEGRGPSFAAVHSSTPVTADKPDQVPTSQVPQWTPRQDDSGELRYHTQAVPFVSALPKTPAPIVVDSVPIALAPPPRALTRRELRELEVSQGLRPEPADGPQGLLADTPAPAAKLPDVLPPTVALPTVLAPPVIVTAAAPLPVVVTPAAPLVAPALIFPVAPAVAPKVPAPVRSAATGPDFAATDRGVDLAPQVFTAPAGHWSTPPSGDDLVPSGAAFIRSVGTTSGAITTNALVIPSMPQASDITRPFGSTGEILITGSIDLPRSLGTTGALPARFDHSDIDALFAAEDNDYSSSDSAPVRAIRAVSTHTSTHGVISAKKPVNNKLPMMMAVTAGILAVGVAALFAAGMIFGYF